MLRRSCLASCFSAVLLVVTDRHALAADPPPPTQCKDPKTTCTGANGYYAPKEDLDRLTGVTDPILKELRQCLDAGGAKNVTPAIVIRWDSEGKPVAVTVEATGYESLPCVAKANGKLSNLQNPRETAIRCEYGCPKASPPTPPPQQPPLVVGPPVAQPPVQQPPVVVGQQQQQAQAVPVVGNPRSVPEKPYAVHYEKVWYGWQGLVADSVGYTLTLAGGFGRSGGILTVGLISFALATPIVHMAHNEVGRGFGSMGMRILLPLLGAGIGAIAGVAAVGGSRNTDNQDTGEAAGTGAIVGAFVGGAGCSIIDAFALGYKSEKVDGPPPPSEAKGRSDVRVVPSIGYGTVGLAGRF